jgi:HlyD family secretion protein
MRHIILTVAGLVALVAGLAAANLLREPRTVVTDWQLVRQPPKEVFVAPVVRGPIVQVITAPGTVESVEEAKIASQVVGRVIAVHVKEGDSVKRGDLLVKLDDADARARLDSARARIARQRAAVISAAAEPQRTKTQAMVEVSRQELVESEATCRISQQELDRTEIRAPIDGVVAGLQVEVGEVVIPGTLNLPGTVLMTVSDLRRMRVRADVDESDVVLVRPGQPALVYLQADQLEPIAGMVNRVSPKGKKKGEKTSAGAQGQAAPAAESSEVVSFATLVRIETNSPALHPGMTATVEIEVRRSPDALGVPIQAVLHRRLKDLPDTPALRAWAERHARSPGDKAFEAETRYLKIVFILDGQVVRVRPVETGLVDERRVEIVSGIRPGDRVVVGPFRILDELEDGQAVTPVPMVSD